MLKKGQNGQKVSKDLGWKTSPLHVISHRAKIGQKLSKNAKTPL